MDHILQYLQSPIIVVIDIILFLGLLVCGIAVLFLRRKMNLVVELFNRIIDKANQKNQRRQANS